MKTITRTALVALMTATLGLSAIAPTLAQDAAPGQPQTRTGTDVRRDNDGQGPRGRMDTDDIINFERGEEAIEAAFDRLGQRLDLTSEQEPLFSEFKTAALAAAADFALAANELRTSPSAQGDIATLPDLTQRLQYRIAMETALLQALESVQPAAVAFFQSLSDEQKAQLAPQRRGGDGMGGKSDGPRQPRQTNKGAGPGSDSGSGSGSGSGSDSQSAPTAPAEAPDVKG